jgi:uncharacterized glyoxalase superfamily protein PhnB
MAANVKPVPEGYHTITPHIIVRNAGQALEFYKQAFAAEEQFRMPGPDGRVMHAELRIGDSNLMLCEECPEMGARSPEALTGSPVTLHIYTKDADAAIDRAVKAGATITMPAENAFWGDRYGRVRDPFGHEWSIATHIEDLTPEEIDQRAAAAMGGDHCGTK